MYEAQYAELAAMQNQIANLQQQLMVARQMNNQILVMNLDRELGIVSSRYEIASRRLQGLINTHQQPQYVQQYGQPQQQYAQPQYAYPEHYNPNVPPQNYNFNTPVPNNVAMFGGSGGGNPVPNNTAIFGISGSNNPMSNIQSASDGMGNRYANKPALTQPNLPPVGQQPYTPYVAEKKLIPLPGSEFPYLLATGLYAEVVPSGEYFRYDIKGEIFKSPIIPSVLTFKNTEVEALTTESLLKNLILTEYMGVAYKTYHVTKHYYEVDETLMAPLEDDLFPNNFEEFEKDKAEFLKKTAKFQNNGNFDEVVNLGGYVISFLTKYGNTVFSSIISKAMTRRLNELFEKAYSLIDFTIDDIHEDFEELTMRYIPRVEDLNKQNKLQRALGLTIAYAIEIINSLTLGDRLEANDSTDEVKVYTNFVHVTFSIEHDVLHLTVDDITIKLMEEVSNTPMVVTEMSHRDLHTILSEYKNKHMSETVKPKSNFGIAHVGKIALHDENQKIVMYSVFVNRENYIIVKD